MQKYNVFGAFDNVNVHNFVLCLRDALRKVENSNLGIKMYSLF